MKLFYRSLVTNGILALLVIVSVGCSKEPPNTNFRGIWQGTITEGDQSGEFELALYIDEDKNLLKGIFNSTRKNGESSDQAASLEIVNVETLGNTLKFVVPMTGKIDDESLIMSLELRKNNQLEGIYQRNRSDGKIINITLTRKPSPLAEPNRIQPRKY